MSRFLFTFLLIGLVIVPRGSSVDGKAKYATMESTIEKLSREFSDMKQTVSMVNQKLASLEAENERLKKYCAKETDSHNDNNKRLLLPNQGTPLTNDKPAFTARLSHHLTGFGNQQTLVFDNVVSNVGNCYSPLTGVFTSKTNGTFFFFASILSHNNHYVETEIVKNGVTEALTYSRSVNTNDQGANAAVLVLTEGDKVWVRHLLQEGNDVYGNAWSSFSGFQI